MDKMNLYKELCRILGENNIKQDEPMAKHSTFRVGGPADFFAVPEKEEQIAEMIRFLKAQEVPYYIIGNGSNLLVGDRGYRGVIIQIYKNMSRVQVEGEYIYAQAGALLSKVAAQACTGGLTGFEFAGGIPGTVGGAVVMNAGAYGGEMKQVLVSARVLSESSEVREVPAEEMKLGYRTSIFAKNGDTILSAVLKLQPGDEGEIRSTMEELKEKRLEKQPLEYPSAGSTFKRPEGYFAGKLIEDAGLRGYQIGGAQVSEKHCGFVINKKEATAADICSLMQAVTEQVEEKFGVKLEPEVKRIGEF